MDQYQFHNVPVVRMPSRESGRPFRHFADRISEKYKVKIDHYWDLHRWSFENFRSFWAEVWEVSEIICSKTYDEVFPEDGKIEDTSCWFRGTRLNYAENLLKYRDDHVALIITGENRETRRVTYSELYQEACRYGAAFRRFGLKKGDRAVCFASNREEPIYAMLGITSIGAILSCALPFLGPQAVLKKFKQLEPKILFTIDETQNDGKKIEMLQKVKEITEGLPSLEKVVIVRTAPGTSQADISGIRNSCFLDDFLATGQNDDGSIPDLEFEQLPFDHPVMISFTSGTTGLPKPLVHGCGVLLPVLRDSSLQFGSIRDFVGICISPPGWSSWNIIFTGLSCGRTTLVYEGFPFFITPTSLWDLVDEFKLSTLFFTPRILDDLEKKGYVPTKKHHLSSLWSIISTGSVLKPGNIDFIYNKLKLDVAFSSIYVSTELMGPCLNMEGSLPIYKGEISCPALGMEVCCYNDEGKPVVGELGELVFRTPIPSLPLCLWNDPDKSKFKQTYFSTFPDVFAPRDMCLINPVTRGFRLYGRSDDTLKPKGTRFGSSEIYSVVDKFPEIYDSICVSQYDKQSDERVVLFVKMREGHHFDQNLVQRIRTAVTKELTERHVPAVILETKDIPINANGKKMEIIVKKIINNMPYNPETVWNSECLKNFCNIQELQDF